jgi:hypothetical protein
MPAIIAHASRNVASITPPFVQHARSSNDERYTQTQSDGSHNNIDEKISFAHD